MQQVPRAALDHPQLLRLLRRQRPGQSLQDDARETEDRIQRRAQLVGHRRQKSRFGPVRRLRPGPRRVEIPRPFSDLAFEALVQVAQRPLGLLALADIDGQDEDPFGDRLGPHVEPPRRPVGEGELRLLVKRDPLRHAAPEHGEDLGLFDAGPRVGHPLTEQVAVRATVVSFSGAVEVQVAPIEGQQLAAFEGVVQRRPVALLALAQGRLRTLAFADVDPHADQAGGALEQNALAGEEVRVGGAVLGQERRLDARLSLLEDLGDPFLQQRSLRARKEVQRTHARDLVGRIAG